MGFPKPYSYYLEPLEEAAIPYCVTSSVAAGIYGELRTTHDIDLVLLLKIGEIARFRAAFPESEYYVPPTEVLVTELHRGQRGCLNLFHHASGFKADLFFVIRDPLHFWAMQHRRRESYGNEQLWIAPSKYVVLRKLEFFREGRQQAHPRSVFYARGDGNGSAVHRRQRGAAGTGGTMGRIARSLSGDWRRESGLRPAIPSSAAARLRLPCASPFP